jgi:hypothetical protein
MVDQLNGFAAKVSRVAREVGTKASSAARPQVKGVAGTWKDLTATSLHGQQPHGQVRNIATSQPQWRAAT